MLSPGAPGAVAPWGSPTRAGRRQPRRGARAVRAEPRAGRCSRSRWSAPCRWSRPLAWAAPRLAELAPSQRRAAQAGRADRRLARTRTEIRKPTLGLALFRTRGAGADAAGGRGVRGAAARGAEPAAGRDRALARRRRRARCGLGRRRPRRRARGARRRGRFAACDRARPPPREHRAQAIGRSPCRAYVLLQICFSTRRDRSPADVRPHKASPRFLRCNHANSWNGNVSPS